MLKTHLPERTRRRAAVGGRLKRYCNTVVHTPRMPRVLCVDDDPDIQAAMEIMFRPYRVEMDHAHYGMEGIVKVTQWKPSLIVMDLAMPNGSGEDLLAVLKFNPMSRDIPVIILTGVRDADAQRRMLLQGASSFLQKPLDFKQILEEASRFIDLDLRERE
ncbi:response regulator [Rhodopirellula sp. P2]|uniref:response regulator n=1 Tax=Rhodopirellula sp. P2 TaxID=2127060 RepID=UPI0023678F7C|nr:response regulator [Rhodopirellula sp. P2]WDQ14554.1 response regulator [Rhodopirellula sp. P2]